MTIPVHRFIFILLIFLSIPSTSAAQTVNIPDPNLRAAIAAELGKAAGDPITTSDMAALTSLTARESNISNLTGLEHAVQLIWLDLDDNSISDITSLSGLTNLTLLYLGRNFISDISTVSGLTNLRSLHLGYNSISDITSLSGLIDLTWLVFQDNFISDISAVSALTNLRTLGFWNNSVSDISAVSGLTNLTELYLGGNSVSDISAVSGLTNLTILNLNNNSVSDISAVSGLTNLRTLSIWNNSVSDISAVSGLTNLAYLNLPFNSVSDISAVSGLTNLTSLFLQDNFISDISAVSDLINLTFLGVGGNSVSDISVVSDLTNLTSLSLADNSISDVSAVSGLTNLEALHLQDNSVSDISAVSGLINLTFLGLWNNSVSDISPLVENTGLAGSDEVHIRGNPLSYLSINTYISTLQSRGVTVDFDDRTPTKLVKISGDNQKEAAFAPLPHPFVIEVQDERGKPFAGVSVVFTLTEGGGTLSITHTTTGAHGRAESTLTFGPNRGTHTVSVSATEIKRVETFNAIADTPKFLWSIPAGISWVHVPLKVTAVDSVTKTIESIGELYDALGGTSVVDYLVTLDSQTQEWFGYFSPSDKGTSADKPLTHDLGIIVRMITATSVVLSGDPLGSNGNSSITLNRGLNLVGLPLRDPKLARVSDLFALDGIGGNVPGITHRDDEGATSVRGAGDASDIPITGAQAFIMHAQRGASVNISGGGWYNSSTTAAAPPMVLSGIQVTDTTPVLALRGSIVDEGTGLSRQGFRVTVKNLSTGRAVAAVATPDEGGYRSTVVDIETGRAATVGNVLEIGAQSTNPFIGVQPLQYAVTAEDVKRSLIQLPALVAYEIPTETELLRNYPNPFNPETWIPYRLAEDAFVTLTIYDGNGQVVRTFDVGHRIAAVYESRSKAIYWDGRNEAGEQVASGVYFYHLSAGDYSATRKMVILK